MPQNDRVILIKGDNSNWYEQAIFIVKKDAPTNSMPMDFVKEAEKIIYNYMIRTGGGKQLVAKYASNTTPQSNKPKQVAAKKKRTGFDLALNIVMVVSIIVLAYIVLRGSLF